MTLDRLFWLCSGLQALAALLAVALAWRRPSYRPTAGFLLGALVASLVRLAMRPWLGAAPVPYVGAARLGFHLDSALFLAWPLGIAALARWTFAGRRPWPVLLAWVLAVAALVLGYPTIRGDLLHKVLLGGELAALAVAVVAFVTFAGARRWPHLEHLAAMLILALEGATLAGPWLAGLYAEGWRGALLSYSVLYAILAVLQGGSLWSRPSPFSPSSSPPSSPSPS